MPIREEVIEILAKKAQALFGVDPSTLNENTRFIEDLNCKSSNFVQFSAALEDEYDVEVPYMEFRKLTTFGEAGDYIGAMFGE
ncbi:MULTISPECIES: acyl carrier protein [Agathobacter]|nr:MULTISPECIES: acyl carrier protein [Agathobacter]MBQ1681280.1 acyl carrier protein [Agathobacter sp.]MCR5677742.1 acyl carrier protein [Agathobacter sp.]MDC7300680.1 acyl carrier protein [Agathobacter ruminis]